LASARREVSTSDLQKEIISLASKIALCNLPSPMRPSPDPRGKFLNSFDGFAADFSRESAARVAAGRATAAADLTVLVDLARELAADVRAWTDFVGRLDVASPGGLAPRRAADMVLETVFQEVLTPAAWRVLATAVELEIENR
jgi:hypothetical protein